MEQPQVYHQFYHDSRAHPTYHDFGLASFPFRPSPSGQLPGGFLVHPNAEFQVQVPELHHLHHQQLQQYQTLPLQQYQQYQTELFQSQQYPLTAQELMAYMENAEEYETFQNLSDRYEPETTGPLVGERQSTSVLATEYAAADPVYIAKTAALPQTYSHFRTSRGDGRCGWRAIAFGYFEGLLRLGDANKFREEVARLHSLDNMMKELDVPIDILEMFFDETHELLHECAKMVGDVNAESFLVQKFNTEDVQNGIIMHLRCLASAWMRSHYEDYAAFVLPDTVEDYCRNYIDPHQQELDHPGMSALTELLLKPAGIGLEVIYLDRSAGDQVNAHSFTPDLNATSVVRLLYRPGHYDLLYKPEDLIKPEPAPTLRNGVPAYLQYAMQHEDPIVNIDLPDVMTMIPGMSLIPDQSTWISDPFVTPIAYNAASLPIQHNTPPAMSIATQGFFPPAPSIQGTPISPTSSFSSSTSFGPATTFNSTPSSVRHVSISPTRSIGKGKMSTEKIIGNTDRSGGVMIRPSNWMYEAGVPTASSHQVHFQTPQFRDSHHNPAHFLNPEFHPEEFDPRKHYIVASSPTRSRLRSSR